MEPRNNTRGGIAYLDVQAYLGITKHIGGRAATDELLARCQVDRACEVLIVGCGIGVTPAYIVKKFGCRVVGVDISEKMIAWSHKRAKQEHVQDQVEFRTADILDLPFDANRFDAVIVESVVAFVPDKARAIRECVRVTKPGGFVGLNESYLTEALSPEIAAMLRRTIGGVDLPTLATWQALWDASGLQNRVVQTHSIDARQEVRDRIQWIGLRWSLEGFARLFYLYLTRPDVRLSLREQFGSSARSVSLKQMEYGLFVGSKCA